MNHIQGVYVNHFTSKEFRGWKMSLRLIVMLDLFRERLKKKVNVSKNKDAIGRMGEGTSQHFFEMFDEVRAIDVIPEGMTKDNAEEYIKIAEECGFTGVGIYPHWAQGPGLHLDVRDAFLAKWGAVYQDDVQVYVSVEEAIRLWDK